MNQQLVVDLARNAITMALMIASPMLIVALSIGTVVSIIQTVTQVQEQTLSFVPKLLAVAGVFLLLLPWILQTLVKYTAELMRTIPAFAS
jgi:flagellar biosynthesis protein FliQ